MRRRIPTYVTQPCADVNCMCKGEGVRIAKVHQVVDPDEFTALMEEAAALPYVEVDQARAIAERTVIPDDSPLLGFMIHWQPYGEA